MFGVFFIAYSLLLKYNMKLDTISFASMVLGFIIILYGVSGYLHHMTSSPIVLLGLYLMWGISAILTYPASFVFNKMQSNQKNVNYQYMLVILGIFLLLAGIAALGIGIQAVPEHLTDFATWVPFV